MLIFTLGFLIIALLAALFGLHGLASGAAGLAGLTFVLVFFAGVAMILWQLFASKHSTPPR
ncbi:MAG TPA: DUF1328 domain-containing protein [Planctomycetota bacterium]|nr:DUF1328 domain-containing protein [Planctomycetota bacterium]